LHPAAAAPPPLSNARRLTVCCDMVVSLLFPRSSWTVRLRRAGEKVEMRVSASAPLHTAPLRPSCDDAEKQAGERDTRRDERQACARGAGRRQTRSWLLGCDGDRAGVVRRGWVELVGGGHLSDV